MKKRILYLVSMLVASFMALPAAAQSESVFTLSANGYVTAGPEKNAFIDEQRCELRNWNSTETVVSFYFRAEQSGKMNVALQGLLCRSGVDTINVVALIQNGSHKYGLAV